MDYNFYTNPVNTSVNANMTTTFMGFMPLCPSRGIPFYDGKI